MKLIVDPATAGGFSPQSDSNALKEFECAEEGQNKHYKFCACTVESGK
jgi:hypothetical protein